MSKINLDFVPEPTEPYQWTKEDWRKKILLDCKLMIMRHIFHSSRSPLFHSKISSSLSRTSASSPCPVGK